MKYAIETYLLTEYSLNQAPTYSEGQAKTMSQRDTIIDALSDLLCQSGVAGLRTKQIAARANVSEALIFHHFGSLIELLACAAAERPSFLSETKRVLQNAQKRAMDEVLDEIIVLSQEHLRPGTMSWAFGSILASRDPKLEDIRAKALELFEQTQTEFATWLSKAAEAEKRDLVLSPALASRYLFQGLVWNILTLPWHEANGAKTAAGAMTDFIEEWRHMLSAPLEIVS